MEITIEDKDLPGLYQTSDNASIKEQKKYFNGIAWYIILLIMAALFTYVSDGLNSSFFNILSAFLFFLSLSIMIWLRVSKPDNIWYNGRAVAESVKTRSWRWMMRAEPYIDYENIDIMRKHFINDLKTILKQNESLIGKFGLSISIEEPISDKMNDIRGLSLADRFEVYRKVRITNQALWYSKKTKVNKEQAKNWFYTTITLHCIAIFLLLYNIMAPQIKLPIEVIALGASSVLTWLQAKKHNELSSSYSLAAHEIVLLKSEVIRIKTEEEFSEYIMNCENAFSREHTQWFARKNE